MQILKEPFSRDGYQASPWQKLNAAPTDNINLSEAVIYDCLIIGAGITGLTAALKLQQAGKKTLIAEAYNIGYGTTGGTSAHINTFADTTYTEAKQAFGESGAQLFADAVNGGFQIIKTNVSNYNIDCDYEEKPGYLYAEDEQQIKALDDVVDGAQQVRVPVRYTQNVPIPVSYLKAAEFPGQAQFHPLKYLTALANEYVKAGGVILTNTFIDNIESKDGLHTVKLNEATVQTENVIYATHTPPGINVFNMRCAPYRSYVMAIKLESDQDCPDALVYDLQEPYHYFRSHIIDGEKLLLVGGNDHKTGHNDPEAAFSDLEDYVRRYFKVKEVKYRWSSQYYVPADGLPYVGQVPMQPDGVWCATGYNGNGMMLGSISGDILADLVLGKENELADLMSTKRLKPVDGFTEFVKENADVAYHFVADRFGLEEIESLSELQPGTGQVIEYNDEKIAAYKDEQGIVHALSPVCTHMKCFVNWNAAEKSWDCPCHGARYDINGAVITGPARQPLQSLFDKQ